MTNHSLKMWLQTTRPKTLPLAAASIITGSALAYWAGSFNWLISLLCFLTTILLQILSNFANDYGDHQKGSDTAERIGPLRGIQQGGISAKQLKMGLWIMALLSFLSGATVIALAYENLSDLLAFAILGLVAIAAAITYTVGKKPYGYLGLGDLSVLIFFGWLGVFGTYYLQAHEFNHSIWLPATACGLLATAVLNINNLRDIEQDRQAGKNTLVVRIGAENGRKYHIALLTIAMFCYLIFAITQFHHWASFVFVLAYPLLIKHLYFVVSHKNPLDLRPMLGQMSMLALLTNLLFSLSLLIG